MRGGLQPVNIISLILSRINGKLGRKRAIPEKNQLITREQNLARLICATVQGSNPQRWDILNFLFAFLILCNLSGWQVSCQNVEFHNQCDYKDISSEKTLNCGVGMSKFVWCQLQLRPIGSEKARIFRGFLPIKVVIKTDNFDRTSTPSTFGDRVCRKRFLHFFKWMELQFISSQCTFDVSIIFGKPEVHPIISLWWNFKNNVTRQFLNLIFLS